LKGFIWSLFAVSLLVSQYCLGAEQACDIWVIEHPDPLVEGPNFDEFDAASFSDEQELREKGIDPESAEDLEDLRKNVESRFLMDQCDCIANLYVLGHGGPGSISVGAGKEQDSSNPHQYVNTDNKNVWKQSLGRLGSLFCEDSTVTLLGCSVGACDKGSAKVHALAQELNTNVRAAVDPVIAGKNFDYLQNGRFQEASPTDQNPPGHMAARKAKAKPKKKNAKKYHCSCNDKTYSDLGACIEDCRVTLGCFVGICTPVHVP
jgi:hypothetical protein